MEWILLLITGVVAGGLSGLFGLGGGIIVVPALLEVFSHNNMPHAYIMHVASGTSLAVMIVTSLSSSYSHFRRGSIVFPVLKRFLPGLLIGVVGGAIAAHALHGWVLRFIFACLLLCIALQIMLSERARRKKGKTKTFTMPSNMNLSTASVVIGWLSGMLGIGGGSTAVPYFNYYGMSMPRAAGTTATCGLFIAIVGTISVMFTGLHTVHLSMSTGYVYWPAFIAISITSVIAAPIGTQLSYRLSPTFLRYTYSALLFCLAINLFF